MYATEYITKKKEEEEIMLKFRLHSSSSHRRKNHIFQLSAKKRKKNLQAIRRNLGKYEMIDAARKCIPTDAIQIVEMIISLLYKITIIRKYFPALHLTCACY